MEAITLLNPQEITKCVRDAVRTELRIILSAEPMRPEDQEGGIDFAKDVLKVYSKATLYRLTCEGNIPFTRRGKTLWFKRADLMQWLADGATTKRNERKAERLAV